jgi:hypothetical protein
MLPKSAALPAIAKTIPGRKNSKKTKNSPAIARRRISVIEPKI